MGTLVSSGGNKRKRVVGPRNESRSRVVRAPYPLWKFPPLPLAVEPPASASVPLAVYAVETPNTMFMGRFR